MLTPRAHQLGTLPTAHGTLLREAPCGHSTHVGTCGACQRRQMAKWEAQLQEANAQANNRMR
jgi:hypothetical protein